MPFTYSELRSRARRISSRDLVVIDGRVCASSGSNVAALRCHELLAGWRRKRQGPCARLLPTAPPECAALARSRGNLIVDALEALQPSMPFPLRRIDVDNATEHFQ